jgi:hypothetical protein
MAIKQLTSAPTESDLESEIHAALQKAFPWIPKGAIRHQTKFSFSFGRASIEVDGTKDSHAEGRTDILLYWGETPLAVLELKRKGVALRPADDEQGLSYAGVVRPRFPLVVVTNGDEVRILESLTGAPWTPASPSESEFVRLVRSAAQASASDIRSAVDTLMGSTPTIWKQAIRTASSLAIEELTGSWDDALLPFARDLLFPRKATSAVQHLLRQEQKFLLIDGAPLSGKSSVLRELVLRTVADPDLVVLYVPAHEGNGIFQRVADILGDSIAWPVTYLEARTWLLRLSHSDGPTLVLALDGIGPEHDRLRHDLEDLSSAVFGPRLKLLVTIDDAVVDKLTMHPKGRQYSAIGRRIDVRISLGLLDDQEFDHAAGALWHHRLGLMPGAKLAPELRVPWVLRSLGARQVDDIRKQPGAAMAMLPSLLSFDLILHTRERFLDDELRRQFRAVATAVIADAEDSTRPIGLTLESLATFVVRRSTLRTYLDQNELESLIVRGFLKPMLHDSGEAVLFIRLPELLASEAAQVLAPELIMRARVSTSETAAWLTDCASLLPLGDVIAACAFVDAGRVLPGIPLEVIEEMLRTPPKKVPVAVGTRAAMHFPGAGLMELTFEGDGSVIAEIGGHRHVQTFDPNDEPPSFIGDSCAWLILSHLAALPVAIETIKGVQRVDLVLLSEVGSCPYVIRRTDTDFEGPGVLTHDIRGYGSIVCHTAGLVEPITLSLFRMLSSEGAAVEDWLKEMVSKDSLALLCRLDIALRETSKIVGTDKRAWAQRMLSELITPALQASSELACDAI